MSFNPNRRKAELRLTQERDYASRIDLIERIRARAEAGQTVHLRPETALEVAAALSRVWPPAWPTREDFGHTVVLYHGSYAGSVIAYCESADLAAGAYAAALKVYPGRMIAQRWGMFTPKKNF